MNRPWVVALLLALLPANAFADVKLPGLFTDHIVLQRDKPIPVWGWAATGEKITVTLAGESSSVTCDASGKWTTSLPARAAGGPHELKIVGNNTITLKDVLIGEVWLCSGQQNMEWWLRDSHDARAEAAAADHPKIRWFTVQRTAQDVPADNVTGVWTVCHPNSAHAITAVGYFFARDIQESLNVPVGLINASWGGSAAEAWTTKESLLADPDLKPIIDRTTAERILWAAEMKQVKAETEAWFDEVEKAKADGRPYPPLPTLKRQIRNPLQSTDAASCMYNGMIVPLAQVPFRGVLWYQGESNSSRAHQYTKLLPALINDWRQTFAQPDLPFFIVQLASYHAPMAVPADSDWAELREAQLKSLAIPHTALAVTIDIGDADRIEPKNKQDVGHRLALLARGNVYGETLVSTGPIYDSIKIDGAKIFLHFKNASSPLATRGNEALKSFAIAGDDKTFVWADAKIDGDTVVVSSETVPHPVAVRYAWADNPQGCNLCNTQRLPASPFRTDNWPGRTDNRR